MKDLSYDQLLRPTTDSTINRGVQRSLARSIVATYDRSYDQSWHPTTDRTINSGIRRTIVRSIVHRRPIVRSIVTSCDRPYEQSCYCRSGIIDNWWCHHARLVVRSPKTYLRPLTIGNRRLEVLNMTNDLAATDFALAIR